MKSRIPALFAAAVLAIPALGAAAPDVSSNSRAGSAAEPRAGVPAVATFDAQPVRFEPNLGQAPPEARFVAHGPRFTAVLTETDFTVAVTGPLPGSLEPGLEAGKSGDRTEAPVLAAGMRLRGGGWNGAIELSEPLPGVSNYLIGDRSNWVTNVSGYGRLTCRDVYPGIDMVFRGKGGDVEYDFIVNPGADPGVVLIELEGSAAFTVDADGSVVMETEAGTVRHSPPQVYQEAGGSRSLVEAQYIEVGDGTFGLDVGSFDASRPLVIDPVLSFSTYFGGGDTDGGVGVDVDSEGRFYVAGHTVSTNFTNVHAIQATNHGCYDATITKFTHSESPVFVYSTYIGGALTEIARGVAVDRSRNPYLLGDTYSVDFPTASPLQVDSGDVQSDCFVVKLNTEGNDFEFSTYLGGNDSDLSSDLDVDKFGNVFVTGITWSTNFPRLHAVQFPYRGTGDAFITGIQSDGAALLFSTYLGGTGFDIGYGIATGEDSSVYVAGSTTSADFPTLAAEQPMLSGTSDSFVTKLTPGGMILEYSTYLGGTSGEDGLRIAVDGSSPVVVGITNSDDFPLVVPLQVNQLGADAFVTRFAADGQSHDFSTYLGGNGTEIPYGVDVGANGHVYVAGGTTSTDFRTHNFIQTDSDGAEFDAFVCEIDPDAHAFVFSTYLGGSLADLALGIAVSGSGAIFVCGSTDSTNFPVQYPTGTDPGDNRSDVFVVRIGYPRADLYFESYGFLPVPLIQGMPGQLLVTVRNNGPDPAGDTIAQFAIIGIAVSQTYQSQGEVVKVSVAPEYHIVTWFAGLIQPGESATISVHGDALATPAELVEAYGYVESSAADGPMPGNEFHVTATVVTITPPHISSIASLVVEGKPYRIRIDGSNFQPGCQVFIGGLPTAWPTVKYKNSTRLILKGSSLRQQFPRGVSVTVRVLNPDSGEDSASFTR